MSADELSNALVQQELLKGSAWSTQAAFEEAVKNAKTEEERAQLLSQIKQASNADELMKQAKMSLSTCSINIMILIKMVNDKKSNE